MWAIPTKPEFSITLPIFNYLWENPVINLSLNPQSPHLDICMFYVGKSSDRINTQPSQSVVPYRWQREMAHQLLYSKDQAGYLWKLPPYRHFILTSYCFPVFITISSYLFSPNWAVVTSMSNKTIVWTVTWIHVVQQVALGIMLSVKKIVVTLVN